MTEPVYVGMPEHDRTFDVPRASGGTWGEIRCGGTCRDDYARIDTFHDAGGRLVILQHAALVSFRAGEDRLRFTIKLTGSHRSCEIQRRLYAGDPKRFAPPDVTAHPRGLAFDVDQSMERDRLAKIRDLLPQLGWHQARGDEPWHWSFGIKV